MNSTLAVRHLILAPLNSPNSHRTKEKRSNVFEEYKKNLGWGPLAFEILLYHFCL